MINLPILHGWEDALPTWMGDPKYQAVGWIYAVWQIFRTNAVLLFCLSYIPFLIRKHIFWKKPKRVMNVVQGRVILDVHHAKLEMERHAPPSPLSYVPKPDEPSGLPWLQSYSGPTLPTDWPDEWKVVEYKGCYYITHLTTLANLTAHHSLFNTELDVIYVKNYVPINATTAVAMEISEQEAFELIFSADYTIRQNMQYIPACMNYVDINSKIWAVLGSLPTLLQAANFNRLSFALSLAIMFLDVNRRFIYHAYDCLFHFVANLVKEEVFRGHTCLYHFFSVFSPRWRYTDPTRRCSYKISSDDTLILHPHSKLRRIEDIAELLIEERCLNDPAEYFGLIYMEVFGIRIWWEERFVVRVPFLGVINLRKLLPCCLRNRVCSDEGVYRALACSTDAYPFDLKARLVTPKPVFVE